MRTEIDSSSIRLVVFIVFMTAYVSSMAQMHLEGEILCTNCGGPVKYYSHGTDVAPRDVKFELPLRKRYASFMHATDGILAAVKYDAPKNKTGIEIDEFDLTGKKRRTIFKCDTLDIINAPFSSWNDSLIVFLGITRKYSIYAMVVNVASGRTKFVFVAGLPSQEYCPWIYGENKFVYVSSLGKMMGGSDRDDALYVYDADTGITTPIDQGAGESSVASPVEPVVAYTLPQKLDAIWLYDFRTGQRTKIYESKLLLSNLRWSPDGKRILFSVGAETVKSRKIISLSDRSVNPVKVIRSSSISWR